MLLKLYILFVKLGFLSFGGGYAMMGLIYAEASQAVGLTGAEFADLAALELLASGAIAINAATYVGYIKAGFLGAVVATAGVCTPAYIFTAVLYYFLNRFKESKTVAAFLNAIKIACGGLLLSTAINIGVEIFIIENGAAPGGGILGAINIAGILLFGLCILALAKFKLGPVKVIVASAVFGILFMR